MSTSTAMVVSNSEPQPYQLVPRTFGEALEWGEFIASSGLAPQELRGKPKDVAIVILSALEMGVPPMMAMRSFPVIKGKISQYAEFMLSRCLASPVCEYLTCVESTEARATWEAKRRGAPAPVRLSYTMEQAVKAGASDMYRKHPAAMLRARASSALCRMVFPDVIGALYAREELDDGQPEPIRARPEPTVVVRPAPMAADEGRRYAITPEGEAALASAADQDARVSIVEASAVAPALPPEVTERAQAAADALELEVASLKVAIVQAPSVSDLEALVPRLVKLPMADRDALRPDFNRCKAMLVAAQAPAKAAAPAPAAEGSEAGR